MAGGIKINLKINASELIKTDKAFEQKKQFLTFRWPSFVNWMVRTLNISPSVLKF
jgi:hypothetical protein